MNGRLILGLSGFGLFMAFATVWVIPSNLEPVFWLAIFGTCAWILARYAPGKQFLHGVFVGLLNSVWITAAHMIFAGAYLERHAHEAQMLAGGPMPGSPRLMMAITGPVIGLISGLVLGLLALIASKFVKPARAPAAPGA